MKRKILLLIVVFLIVVICLGILTLVNFRKTDSIIVKTDSGRVRGYFENGLRVFLGIPYAQPPVGDLRWKKPEPVKSWKDIKLCNEFGPACPQPKWLAATAGDVGKMSEDCLYLNIWTPAKSSQMNLPVMVWIYGGGFIGGAGSLDAYNGIQLAKHGVVVITINYRLGALGFLAHPELCKESVHGVCGNYGLLDQIEALKWIQKNISNFGGNPNNVTIFGESAGSVSVSSLLLAPPARGLFHRAIMESGTATTIPYMLSLANGSIDQAFRTGKKLSANLGCDKNKDIIACMRKKSADEIIAASDIREDIVFGTEGLMFGPVFDGWLFPDDPKKLLIEGEFYNIPIIIGSNKDEGNLFIPDDFSIEKYKKWLVRTFKDSSNEVFSKFKVENNQELRPVVNRLITVLSFAQPARLLAKSFANKNGNAYLYQFTRVAPASKEEEKMGAYHGIEMPYVFGHITNSKDERDISLSDAIMQYWVNFARTGTPDSLTLPEWPAYDTSSGKYIGFGDQITIKSCKDNQDYDLIEKITE